MKREIYFSFNVAILSQMAHVGSVFFYARCMVVFISVLQEYDYNKTFEVEEFCKYIS